MAEARQNSVVSEDDHESSNNSSANPSRPGSVGTRAKLHHNRVKFSVSNDDERGESPAHTPATESVGPLLAQTNPRMKNSIPEIRVPSPPPEAEEDVTDMRAINLREPDWSGKRQSAALSAQDRASRLASRLSRSAPGSRRNSIEATRHVPNIYPMTLSPTSSPPTGPSESQPPISVDDIPLMDLGAQSKSRRPFSLYEESTDEDSEEADERPLRTGQDLQDLPTTEAHRLVRTMTPKVNLGGARSYRETSRSGTATPALDKYLHDVDYVPPPVEYKTGILSSLLKLYDQQGAGASLNRTSVSGPSNLSRHSRRSLPRDVHPERGSGASGPQDHSTSDPNTPGSSGHNSGRVTPRKKPKWYDQKSPGTRSPGNMSPPAYSRSHSTSSMAHLLQSSVASVVPGLPSAATRPQAMPRSRSGGMIAAAVEKIKHPAQQIFHHQPRLEEELTITVHIAEILARQRYLIKLCRALMMYGAPTHRLEEYMRTSARALQIEGQFLYLPSCMIVSFDDPDTHTTEVKLVKENQGVDLGKFKDSFTVYKNVVHDVWGVEEATQELEEIMSRREKFSVWGRILMYGVASVAVGPFAFGARPIDFPICFVLGCLIGFLQLVVAPRSDQFQHVFEVAAAVVTSFLARAFGSIKHDGEYVFCFSALAQSSIALILPGYIILCASLELQSRNIVAGSVRMVYAIIYALFLGFGITIGTALFGLMDTNAVRDITCSNPPYWTNTYITHFPFVPLFTLCLIIINQAKWKQAPVMLLIAFAGYMTNFWASRRLANNVQVANALGAFVVGSLANLYSRFFHGLAAAAMLPAIFVQVPSGLAASGSLVAGLTSAEQITGNATGISVVNNGTAGFVTTNNSGSEVYGGTIFNVGYGMVQVAIGISVGLFLSALVVYPVGKKRSGLFSF